MVWETLQVAVLIVKWGSIPVLILAKRFSPTASQRFDQSKGDTRYHSIL
jgi:hypothetical protein